MARSKAQLSNYTLLTPFTQTGTEQQANNALKMKLFLLLHGCPCCSTGCRCCPLLFVVVVPVKSCGGKIAEGTRHYCASPLLPSLFLPSTLPSKGLMKVSGYVTGQE